MDKGMDQWELMGIKVLLQTMSRIQWELEIRIAFFSIKTPDMNLTEWQVLLQDIDLTIPMMTFLSQVFYLEKLWMTMLEKQPSIMQRIIWNLSQEIFKNEQLKISINQIQNSEMELRKF